MSESGEGHLGIQVFSFAECVMVTNITASYTKKVLLKQACMSHHKGLAKPVRASFKQVRMSSNDRSENMHACSAKLRDRWRKPHAHACVSQIFHAPEALHDGMKY